MPLNVIESNTELISYYRKKRQTEPYDANLPGLSINSVDSWETLSDAAKLALASILSPSSSSGSQSNVLTTPKADSYFKELLYDQQKETDKTHTRVKRYEYEPTDRINMIFKSFEMLSSEYGRKNCYLFSESQRRLPGDVIYGADIQFESQAKLALSISHFLSSFYQIINPEEDFPLRNAEKSISEDQLYAEVISAIAADFKVNIFVFSFSIFFSNSFLYLSSKIYTIIMHLNRLLALEFFSIETNSKKTRPILDRTRLE